MNTPNINLVDGTTTLCTQKYDDDHLALTVSDGHVIDFTLEREQAAVLVNALKVFLGHDRLDDRAVDDFLTGRK